MKKINQLLVLSVVLLVASCSNKDRYIDLRTGQTVEVEKDANGIWVNTSTKKPVYILVDTKKNDTIYGKTGAVINGHVVRSNDNVYWYDADTKHDDMGGDYKRKVEDDGDIKIKTDDKKIKIDGETGKKTVKND